MDIDQTMLQLIEDWKSHEISKILLNHLVEHKERIEKSLTEGHLLESQTESGIAVGQLNVINAVLNPVETIRYIEPKEVYDDDGSVEE